MRKKRRNRYAHVELLRELCSRPLSKRRRQSILRLANEDVHQKSYCCDGIRDGRRARRASKYPGLHRSC